MSRRDTILISVFVNTGLLVVLFITALTFKETPKEPPAAVAQDMTTILAQVEKDVQAEPNENDAFVKIETEAEAIVHKLPAIVTALEAKKEEIRKEEYQEIIVQKGDSLERIAKNFKTSVTELQKINKLSGALLKLNQSLKVPKNGAPKNFSIKTQKNNDFGEFYIVKCGDNPWTIAMKHHLKTEDLLKMNNLDKEKAKRIRPGDRLRIR